MNEIQQAQIETQKIEYYEDEIELIDILRIIWKWKYRILVASAVCGMLAVIISLNMEKIYSIDMVLRPGILRIGTTGQIVFIDSPQNIKAIIDSGTFDSDLIEFLKISNSDNIPKEIQFKVTIPRESDTIKIQYETSDIKQGIELENRLIELLLNLKKEFIKKTTLSYKNNVENIEKRINELTTELDLIKKNAANLIKERDKLISNNPKKNNVLSVLLYSNTIQQNLKLSNDYQNEINEYKTKKEEELLKIDNIQNIQILQPATRSQFPIKPRILRNVVLALVAGFFLMMFLALFLEYISKYKNKGD